MPSIDERVRGLREARQRAWEAGKEILTNAQRSGRGMSAEDDAAWNRANSEIARLDKKVEDLLASDENRREVDLINEELRKVTTPTGYQAARDNEKTVLSDFIRGRTSAINIDLRAASYASQAYREGARGDDFAYRAGIFGDTGSSGGSLTIPSLVSSQVFQVMTSANILRRTRTTILTTPSGAPMSIPVGTQGAATQVANQDTTIGGTDPTMASKVLRAYDAGELVAVSNDLIQDSGVDVLAWVSQNIALAVGSLEETWTISGAGSTLPTGIMRSSAVGAAGTVATGGSLILGAAGAVGEKLIDVVYSVNNSYRANAEWLFRDSTTATVRKIRDGAGGTSGAFLFQPSTTAGLPGGEPDRLLGYPVWSSSNVAAMGSDATVAAFGDFSRFVIREVGGLRLERSTDVFFAKNQIGMRGVSRVDSVLTDVTAINYLHQAVT